MLIWRFHGAEGLDLAGSVAGLIAGPTGDRLAGSGIMVALVSAEGRIRAANRVFSARALGHEEGAVGGPDFARFLTTPAHGAVPFERSADRRGGKGLVHTVRRR